MKVAPASVNHVMRPDEQKFVVHEGLTEIEQMKLEMLGKVTRNGVRALAILFAMIVMLSLLRGLAGTFG